MVNLLTTASLTLCYWYSFCPVLTFHLVFFFYSDVWSLGVILFMLVCGVPPFQEANDSETLTMIMDCKYLVPEHISSSCKEWVSQPVIFFYSVWCKWEIEQCRCDWPFVLLHMFVTFPRMKSCHESVATLDFGFIMALSCSWKTC